MQQPMAFPRRLEPDGRDPRHREVKGASASIRRLWSEKLGERTHLTEHRIPMIKSPKNRNSIDANAKLQVHHETLRVLRTHELTGAVGAVGATAAPCVNPSFKCL